MQERLYQIRTNIGSGLGEASQAKTWPEIMSWLNWLSQNQDFIREVSIYEVECFGLDSEGEPKYMRKYR